jgi:hypothetical protein
MVQITAPNFVVATEMAADFARSVFPLGWIICGRLLVGVICRQRSRWWIVYLAMEIGLAWLGLGGWWRSH